MRIFNKMLLSGLGALTMAAALNPAYADEAKKEEETSDVGAIIFRIENIQPVTNKDGIIDKCNFIVTAFNRMNKAVAEAKLKFSWEDNISGKFSLNGQDIKVNTGKDAKTVVSADVTMSDIASHAQKSFQVSVDTDKCFLLFDNLTYTVESCMNEGEKIQVKNSKVVIQGKGCAGNFDVDAVAGDGVELRELGAAVDAEAVAVVVAVAHRDRAAVGAQDLEHVGQVVLALRVVAADLVDVAGEKCAVERVAAGVALQQAGALLGRAVLLLDDAQDLAVGVELDAAVASRVGRRHGEHRGGLAVRHRRGERLDGGGLD